METQFSQRASRWGLEAMSKTQFVIIMNFTGHHHSESDA